MSHTQGSSHSDDVYNTIREAAQRATSVFVILDGDHSDFNVRVRDSDTHTHTNTHTRTSNFTSRHVCRGKHARV